MTKCRAVGSPILAAAFGKPPRHTGKNPGRHLRPYFTAAGAFREKHMGVDKVGTGDVNCLYIYGRASDHSVQDCLYRLNLNGSPVSPAGRSTL